MLNQLDLRALNAVSHCQRSLYNADDNSGLL